MGRIGPLLIITFTLLVFDFYIYRAILNVGKQWSPLKKRNFKILWWGYTIVLLAGVYLSIYFNIFLTARAVILVAFFLTFITKFVFIPFLLLDDLRRLITYLFRSKQATTPKETVKPVMPRSEFLMKTGLTIAAIPFISLSWGIAKGAYDYRVRKRNLFLKNLPSSFEGLKLAQISDIHSGSFYNQRAVAGGVDLLMAEKPDIIFFTGDLVNGKFSEMKDYQGIFSRVKAPLGVYSTLGNHDYGLYEKWPDEAARLKNLENLKQVHKLMGWDLLMNENRSIKINNEEIGVLGIENWGAGRFPKFGKMDEAIKNTDDFPVKLLLSHDPSHWKAEILKKYPQIDAMFSGHTHGMQFGVDNAFVKWSPVQYIYDEWAGLYKQGDQQLYVNVGYGFLGYPGRVGILPEITIFELKRG